MTMQASQSVLGDQLVLVVDDNAINREFLRAVLDQHVAGIRVAQDGATALEMVREWRPDLVLMDLHMPGMDGLETWRRMCAQLGPPPPSTVVLTADWRPEERKRLLGEGFDAFLGKPVDAETLLDCLRNVIARPPGAGASAYQQSTARADGAPPLLDDQRALATANRQQALVAQMRTLLLDELHDASDQFDARIARGDTQAVRDMIHQLKGGCGYAGATRLMAACGEFERALAGPHPGAAYLQLVRALAQTQLALQQAITERSNGPSSNRESIPATNNHGSARANPEA